MSSLILKPKFRISGFVLVMVTGRISLAVKNLQDFEF